LKVHARFTCETVSRVLRYNAKELVGNFVVTAAVRRRVNLQY